MTDVLSATDLVKEYPVGQTSAPVLRGIDRSIQAGDYIAIMGPSGSGKTTLLNCLSSLDAPTSGRVVLDGQELTAVSESERAAIRLRRIGFVFQHPTFLANLNLLDNIVLPGYLAGHPRADVAKRALELVEAMGVADLCERTITQASGGQLQRVAICRALINAPVVVFGDEPTGALNQATAREVLDILDRINKAGSTLVLVTHDPRVAAHATRVLVMSDGQFIAEQGLGPWSDASQLPRREEALSRWLLDIGI